MKPKLTEAHKATLWIWAAGATVIGACLLGLAAPPSHSNEATTINGSDRPAPITRTRAS